LDFRFWTGDPEVFSTNNYGMVFAYSSISEKPMVYLRRHNVGATVQSYMYTNMELVLKDAEELCGYAERVIKEVDETDHDKSIPILAALGDKARMGYKEDDFWEHGVFISTLEGVRCRAVEDKNHSISLVINTPRSSKAYGEDYIGPVFCIPIGIMRDLFKKMRENLSRFSNNTA